MAKQIIADLYGCDYDLLNSEIRIKEISRNLITDIGANIIEECVKKFEPIGITYFAIISTSHFSIHTWPEYNYLALDVFSCNDMVTDLLFEGIKNYFNPNDMKIEIIDRRINKSGEI